MLSWSDAELNVWLDEEEEKAVKRSSSSDESRLSWRSLIPNLMPEVVGVGGDGGDGDGYRMKVMLIRMG